MLLEFLFPAIPLSALLQRPPSKRPGESLSRHYNDCIFLLVHKHGKIHNAGKRATTQRNHEGDGPQRMAALDGMVRENAGAVVDFDLAHNRAAVCKSYHQYGRCHFRIFQLAADMDVFVRLQHHYDHVLFHAEHILLER